MPPSRRYPIAAESTLVGLAVLVVYVRGAAPSIYVGDSGELVAAVAALGIPHPSGYPLYVLLGQLWTLLVPLGSVAYRMSLFSAVTAAIGWWRSRSPRMLALTFFVCGLGSTNHTVMAVIAIAFAVIAIAFPLFELASRRRWSDVLPIEAERARIEAVTRASLQRNAIAPAETPEFHARIADLLEATGGNLAARGHRLRILELRNR